MARDGVGEASRRAASGTGEGDIDPTEIVVVLEQADGMGLAPEEVLAARATFGTKQKKVIDRNWRSSRMRRSSCPTAPLAPTIAIFIFLFLSLNK